MNDQQFKELIKKSEIQASNDFTHKLMSQIKTKKESPKVVSSLTFMYVIGGISIVFILITATIFFGNFFIFSLKNIRLQSFKIPVFLILSLSFLMSINHLLKLRQAIESS